VHHASPIAEQLASAVATLRNKASRALTSSGRAAFITQSSSESVRHTIGRPSLVRVVAQAAPARQKVQKKISG
jgi:hypothetical protein